MISSFSAARFICERGGWDVTNLQLQKILYLAHMVRLGAAGEPLVDGYFEAWDYGPVEPRVYKCVRSFGSKPIADIFPAEEPIPETVVNETLAPICDSLISKRPSELVAITHWEGGAWAKLYQPGVRGIVIDNQSILDEYRARSVTGA